MEVLIVDDDEEDIEFYAELIDAIGNDVTALSFKDPRKALSHLIQTNQLPDHIVLDFNMPHLTGLEFLKILRDDPHLSHLQVTVITTKCSTRDAAALRELDAECHQKPSTFAEFKSLLLEILAK